MIDARSRCPRGDIRPDIPSAGLPSKDAVGALRGARMIANQLSVFDGKACHWQIRR